VKGQPEAEGGVQVHTAELPEIFTDPQPEMLELFAEKEIVPVVPDVIVAVRVTDDPVNPYDGEALKESEGVFFVKVIVAVVEAELKFESPALDAVIVQEPVPAVAVRVELFVPDSTHDDELEE